MDAKKKDKLIATIFIIIAICFFSGLIKFAYEDSKLRNETITYVHNLDGGPFNEVKTITTHINITYRKYINKSSFVSDMKEYFVMNAIDITSNADAHSHEAIITDYLNKDNKYVKINNIKISISHE